MTTEQTPTPSLPPTIIAIFGITGDLARRYLLPSLYSLFQQGLVHEKTLLVGISRRQLDPATIFAGLEAGLQASGKPADAAVLKRMRHQTHGFQLDMDNDEDYRKLLGQLNRLEDGQGICLNRLYYLAIPPAAYGNVISRLGQGGLNGSCAHGQAMTRILVEKPFGNDLASAEALIASTAQAFGEDQIYRIDHYLAKETAQNISTFRFENPLFETIWNNKHVAGIDIVASEKIGVEGRVEFYEQQGALRDFIQNHLLQLLAIATMDQPEYFDSEAVHAAKLTLLRAVRPIMPEQVAMQASRGQYAGYREDVGNPESFVETYASIETLIDTPRWEGVPVRISTGKALAAKSTTVTFRFEDRDPAPPNLPNTNDLQFRIQPDEGIALHLLAKKPGFTYDLQPVTMDFAYRNDFSDSQPDAYERVLLDAIRGDQTLFTSSQEVLAAWQVVDAVVQAWRAGGDGLATYQPGTAIERL